MMNSMQQRIRAVYRENTQVSRLEVMRALGLHKPTQRFDSLLVEVQGELRGDRPPLTFTKGLSKFEMYQASTGKACIQLNFQEEGTPQYAE
jgi:hypothetical protein